jgi:hypothetical protein
VVVAVVVDAKDANRNSVSTRNGPFFLSGKIDLRLRWNPATNYRLISNEDILIRMSILKQAYYNDNLNKSFKGTWQEEEKKRIGKKYGKDILLSCNY